MPIEVPRSSTGKIIDYLETQEALIIPDPAVTLYFDAVTRWGDQYPQLLVNVFPSVAETRHGRIKDTDTRNANCVLTLIWDASDALRGVNYDQFAAAVDNLTDVASAMRHVKIGEADRIPPPRPILGRAFLRSEVIVDDCMTTADIENKKYISEIVVKLQWVR